MFPIFSRMRSALAAMALLALLPACTTLQEGASGGHGDGAAEPLVHAQVSQGLEGLRALVADLQVPIAPDAEGHAAALDAGGTLALLDQARLAVITAGAARMDQPGLSAKAELATLAILLSLCRERVRAADGLVPASVPALSAARMLTQRCVAPLALILG